MAVYPTKEVMAFGPTGIGWTLVTVGVMDIVSQGLLTRMLLQRVDAEVLARIGLHVNALGFALIACVFLFPRIEYLLASIVIFTLGDGLFQPSISGIIANAAPNDSQGLVQGANQSQQVLARMLGPLLAAMVSSFAVNLPYWAGALVAVAGVTVLSISSRYAAR